MVPARTDVRYAGVEVWTIAVVVDGRMRGLLVDAEDDCGEDRRCRCVGFVRSGRRS